MTLKEKHRLADNKLFKLSSKHSNSATAKHLAMKFNVSPQTILNYLHGLGADGYLKDCIIESLLKNEL